MSKIRLTKNEFKKQKEALKRFHRYLPMLLLKKKQLQLEIIKVHQRIKAVAKEIEDFRNSVIPWVDVFSEEAFSTEFCELRLVKTEEGNVAGVDLPVFAGVEFDEKPYDLLRTPWWVDKAVLAVEKMITFKAKLSIYHEQLRVLKQELRIVTQRVNLFEKIKIPEAKENIRVIQIYLGELQTAEVVRGKIAKSKIERRKILAGI